MPPTDISSIKALGNEKKRRMNNVNNAGVNHVNENEQDNEDSVVDRHTGVDDEGSDVSDVHSDDDIHRRKNDDVYGDGQYSGSSDVSSVHSYGSDGSLHSLDRRGHSDESRRGRGRGRRQYEKRSRSPSRGRGRSRGSDSSWGSHHSARSGSRSLSRSRSRSRSRDRGRR